MTMTLIETKTLGTAAASIEFTSIPQDGTDLLIYSSTRTNRSAIIDNERITINGTTSGFTVRYLYGSGSTVTSAAESVNSVEFVNANTSTSNTFSNKSIYIPNYTGSTAKSYSVDVVGENNATESYQVLLAGLFSGTSAITSLLFSSGTGNNLLAGTTISLYKITKGSSGGVTVS
jgi:hypothetical protein